MKGNVQHLSLIAIGAITGAIMYDVAIKIKISYNEREPGMLCQNGIAFEQVNPGSTVYLKTDIECINETMKGIDNDNSDRNNSTQN